MEQALAAYEKAAQPERVEPIVRFLTRHTDSPWRQSLWLNLGDIYYQQGFFSDALHAWRESWNGAKAATGPKQRAVADQALGELIRMHARLGHADEVEALLLEVEKRPLVGAATEAVQGAREGLWKMRNEPGVAYLCGPMALKSLVTLDPKQHGAISLLDAARSGPNGFSLEQVAALSQQAGLPYRAVHRERGDEIPVPSVVHWRVNHYAAIVGEENGRYHIKDPTFGRDLWLTAAAINTQTSGYFLVATEQANKAWRSVGSTEARAIRGMGFTTAQDDKSDRPYDDKECDDKCGSSVGMPTYAVHSMLVSLNIQDTPVGYSPPKGPAVAFTVTYNQREAYQPALLPFSNLGLKWTHNWLSYVTDNPLASTSNVAIAVAGGGTELYTGYNSTTGQFAVESRLGATLVRTSWTPIAYERRFSDGSVHVYQQSDGTTVNGRRVYLTAVRDPAGNEVTLTYDAQLRLIGLTDALGQVTVLSYFDIADPLRLTRVTDPFGRYASFGYDANGRLSQITDVIGLSSSFGYDGGTFINAMTTPYGTTTFSYGESGITRWLQITDPLGRSERVETLHSAPGIAGSEPVVPSGILAVNNYLQARNTYYWDKDAWALAPGDYTKAVLKHWLHAKDNGSVTSPTLESIKRPGENRLWFNYQGQVYGHFAGPTDWLTASARVLDDGSTQITRNEYNAIGRPTRAIDAAGRETVFEYAANNIDLLRVKRKNGGTYDVLAQFTYDAQHRPLTQVDAAGQTTVLTYNSAGQPLTVTNALAQTTTNEYDANGYLLLTRNANNVVQQSFTYDAYGRVRTTTDSEGYVLTYDYDALDRLTRTTYPDGTFDDLVYDKLDVFQWTGRQARITTYTYNAVRQLTAVDEPIGTYRIEWSPAGRRTALIDRKNQAVRWEYDIAGRQTAEVYADATRKTYAYDLAGRLKSITDALNQVKTISYTADNQVAGLTYTNAVNATPSVAFAYDPVYPRLTVMMDGIVGLGTGTTFAYGAIGAQGALQVIREDGPNANDVIAYSYDALGRRSSRTIGGSYDGTNVVGGEVESFSYDALGRLQTKTSALGAFTFGYLGQTGQLSQRTVAASGTLNTPAMLLTYETNAKDRQLKQIRYAKIPVPATADLLQDYDYRYSVTGQPTRIEETSYGAGGVVAAHKIWTVQSPSMDRLHTYAPANGSDAGTSWYEYAYDRADNRDAASLNGTMQTITYNSVNQATKVNSIPYIYDANGNLISIGTGWGATVLKWDAENRLISYKSGLYNTTTFNYDGFGRRLQTNGSSTAKTFRQLWCDHLVCQTRTGTNFDTVYATWFDEGYLSAAESRRGGGDGDAGAGAVSNLYMRDQLGSVRQIRPRNNTNVGKLEYGPYGELVSASGSPIPMPRFGYANMYQEKDVPLYFTLYRAYNQNTGGWLSRDPIGAAAGTNMYGYVSGKPLSSVDPVGLAPPGCGSGRCIGPTNRYKQFPDFSTLWRNYPRTPDGTPAHPSSGPYRNQCAIRLGKALEDSGVDFSTYPSINKSEEGWPRSAQNLADWLTQQFGKPQVMTNSQFEAENNWYQAHGIIFQPGVEGQADHIDLHNGGWQGSGYYRGVETWYWPVK